MKTTLLARLGGVAVITLTGFAGVASPTSPSDSFRAAVGGAVRASISGKATFGRVAGGPGSADVFTLNLGTDTSRGAVLLTQTRGIGLGVGRYRISDPADGPDELQALVMLGRADRPEGVFRAQSGTLTITSVSDREITGRLSLDATGFLASAPQQENRQVYVSGSFTARAAD